MKRFASIVATSLIVLLLAGCASISSGKAPMRPDLDTYTGLSVALDEDDTLFLYDVRTPEEYVTGHIPGAVNIPHGEIARKLPFWKKNDVIVVYCASGGRSFMAYEALTGKGFKRVVDFGGVGNWEGSLIEGTE